MPKLFGEDTVFMGLAISIDGTMSNLRAVEICPVSVSILNLIGDESEKLYYVPYFPLKVHQSNTELRQLLEAKGVGTVKAKDELIKIITKKLEFDFMYNIFKEGSEWMFTEGTLNLEEARPYGGQQMDLEGRKYLICVRSSVASMLNGSKVICMLVAIPLIVGFAPQRRCIP